MIIEPTDKEQIFIEAYLDAIDFTETGDTDQPETGAELCEVFKRECVIDCLSFYNRIACYLSDENISQAGQDFWLSRNGHGSGFWDRPEIYKNVYAEMFNALAEQYGNAWVCFENDISDY